MAASKTEQIAHFDPNGVGHRGRLFGLPFTPETAKVVIIPVPWDVTVSYTAGTSGGPMAVLEASSQIDYFLRDIPDAWKIGIAMEPISSQLAERSASLRTHVELYIEWLEAGNSPDALPEEFKGLLQEVDEASRYLNKWLAETANNHLEQGKIVGVLGGDHSSPLGLMQALSRIHDNFGILQIDAHADLRVAYEGFTFSHASIMTNALELSPMQRLVQVGVRDYSESEKATVDMSKGRILSFYDQALKEEQFSGKTWREQCGQIIDALPENVYISLDIDGLDPKLCPNTGTPVPGGFELDAVLYLVQQLVASGRQIIGFDLCEVAPGPENEWDGNVGARALYGLASWAGISDAGQP